MNNQENKTAEQVKAKLHQIIGRPSSLNPVVVTQDLINRIVDQIAFEWEEYAQLVVTQTAERNKELAFNLTNKELAVGRLVFSLEQKGKEIEAYKKGSKQWKATAELYEKEIEELKSVIKSETHHKHVLQDEIQVLKASLEQAKKENDKGLIRLERQLSASKEVIDELNKRIENQMITIGEFQKGIGKLINAPLGEVAYFGENEERKLKELIYGAVSVSTEKEEFKEHPCCCGKDRMCNCYPAIKD